MTETRFDHDRRDVYRLAIQELPIRRRSPRQAIDYEHEHRFAEHEHEEEPEHGCT